MPPLLGMTHSRPAGYFHLRTAQIFQTRRGRHDDPRRRHRVSHWHALHDAAYLRHLVAMPDVELVAIQDYDASLVMTGGYVTRNA
jgi:hypothetical protein